MLFTESISTFQLPLMESTEVIENLSRVSSCPVYRTLYTWSPTVTVLKLPASPNVDFVTRQLLLGPITHVPSDAVTLNCIVPSFLNDEYNVDAFAMVSLPIDTSVTLASLDNGKIAVPGNVVTGHDTVSMEFP